MLSQSVAHILDNHVTLTVEGIDRRYLHAYIPKLQYEQGVAWSFRGHRQQVGASPVDRRAKFTPDVWSGRVQQEGSSIWLAVTPRHK